MSKDSTNWLALAKSPTSPASRTPLKHAENPDLEVRTDLQSLDESVATVVQFLEDKGVIPVV